MKNLRVSKLQSYRSDKVEIVERKGLGHPDTICDLMMEEVSRVLSNEYIDKFGFIMHHNVDKALLIGGVADSKYGGGKVTQPIEIYLTGRVTKDYNGKNIDVDSLSIETVKNWLRENIPNLNVERDVMIIPKFRPGSKDLVELFERFQLKDDIPLANDTSFGVGYAPFSELERLVLNVEKELNSREFKKEHRYLGEDIKIMGVRNENIIDLTIAAAFVDKYIQSEKEYYTFKEKIGKYLWKFTKSYETDINFYINTADQLGSVYTTVTGTSAEAGDDGMVGRGNRMNGLITPYRPVTLEAAAGKNPVSHVGKIYNAAADLICKKVKEGIQQVEAVECFIVSQIGKPITEPQVIDVNVKSNDITKHIEDNVTEIVSEVMRDLPNLWAKYIEGKITVA